MQSILPGDITPDKISLSSFAKKEIEVTILRLDKIHSIISGNKWFKLRYYLEEAKQQKKKKIVTFGGAYSNHIVATAAACKMNRLKSIGIIRGEEVSGLSPTLSQAKEMGMQLFFISRENYRNKIIPDEVRNDDHYLINEGGFGEKGAKGAATILDHCEKDNFSHYCCAVGTGTMMAGLINASLAGQSVIGISVMKNNFELEENIISLITKETNYRLIHDYHFGGYAKYTKTLIRFMNEFYRQTFIPSDFVYTGKLFYAISDLIEKNYFLPRSRLLIIHSGGLQGNVSLGNGTLIF